MLAILGLLAGILVWSGLPQRFFGQGSDRRARQEAQWAARWFGSLLTRGIIEGRPFVFSCSTVSAQTRLRVVWSDNGRTETYDSRGGCWFELMGSNPSASFASKVCMMVPGFTLRVRPAPGRPASCYIRVSPYCRVTITDTPP